MIQDLGLHRAARRSLLSMGVTAALITINHLPVLGPRAFGLGAVLIVAPALLLWWFKRTRSTVAFAGYLAMNLWVVIGFGLLKGLWKSTLPVFVGTLLSALATSYPRPTLAPVWVEVSGVAMFIGSAFVAAFAYQLVRVRWSTHARPSCPRRPASSPSGSSSPPTWSRIATVGSRRPTASSRSE